MAAPDDKQKRLSTLSQDVIAVPKKPAPPPPPPRRPEPPVVERPAERPAERREIPAAQDVFRVTPPSAVVPPEPPVARPAPAAGQSASGLAGMAPVTLASAAVAVLALLVALFAVLRGGGEAPVVAAVADPEVSRLSAELAAANERVAKLEARLNGAATDAPKPGTAGQVNVLQLSANMRSLRDDIDRVSNKVDGLQEQVAEARSLAGAAGKDGKMALAQGEQLAARLATVNQQLAGAPKAAAAAAPAGDVQAQLKALTQKTDKLATDIRQLYRQVGTQ